MTTVMASFNTIMGQMTKLSQRKNKPRWEQFFIFFNHK